MAHPAHPLAIALTKMCVRARQCCAKGHPTIHIHLVQENATNFLAPSRLGGGDDFFTYPLQQRLKSFSL